MSVLTLKTRQQPAIQFHPIRSPGADPASDQRRRCGRLARERTGRRATTWLCRGIKAADDSSAAQTQPATTAPAQTLRSGAAAIARGLKALLARVVAPLEARRRRSRKIDAAREIDARTLADIGLSRGAVEFVVMQEAASGDDRSGDDHRGTRPIGGQQAVDL
jgi:uncharacterized protein YjiS (DUF1127 family)